MVEAPRRPVAGLVGIRGLACLSVIYVHSLALTAPQQLLASRGTVLSQIVVLFFALSGFLLSLPFLRAAAAGRPTPSLARYARQRLLRILPAYLVVLFLANFLLAAVYLTNAVQSAQPGTDAGTGRITDPLRLLEHALLVQTFIPSEIQTGLNPAWTLTVELSFYLALPLLMLLARKGWPLLPAGLMVLVGLTAQAWVVHLTNQDERLTPVTAMFGDNAVAVLSQSLLVQADDFGWGMAVAVAFVRWESGGLAWCTPALVRWLALPLALLGALATSVGVSRGSVWSSSFMAVASAALLLMVVEPAARGRSTPRAAWLDASVVGRVGRWSLGTYLWHYPVLLLAVRHGLAGPDTPLGAVRSVVIVGAVSVALGGLTFGLVETPARRWGRGSPAAPPVVIVHDYLTQRGGAERVVLAMARVFPGAPIYTAFYDPAATFPEFRDLDVRVLPLNRFGWLRRHHRLALLLLPFAIAATKIRGDVVLASSSGWSHGYRVSGRMVVYCYSPARWLYQSRRYLGVNASLLSKGALWSLRPPLRWWDQRAADRASEFLAISTDVQQRILAVYGRQATIVTPPVPLVLARSVLGAAVDPTGYYLCVSRLLPYKHVDVVVEAFASLPDRQLVVVGQGPELSRLMSSATANVTFLSEISDAELSELYQGCQALIAISHEDFGLTPLEAASLGRPSIVLRWGGYLDTMVDDVTAVFVDLAEVPALLAGVARLEARSWDQGVIRAHASTFSEATFADELRLRVLASVPPAQRVPLATEEWIR